MSVLNKAAAVYVTLFRNTPLLIQIFIIFFGLGALTVALEQR